MSDPSNSLAWTSSSAQSCATAHSHSSPAPGSSSPSGFSSYENVQQRPPSSPLASYATRRGNPVTPGSFVSPRHSKQYPIPSTTADVLEARRNAFFRRGNSDPRQHKPTHSPNISGVPMLVPGPSSASRLRTYKKPANTSMPSFGGAAAGDTGDAAAALYRQRFRERCQAVMARDRGRNRALAKARGRDVLHTSPHQEEGQDDTIVLRSDDLSSSDMEDEGSGWQEEDEELMRRVMLAEYRRLWNAQEYSGQRELGWLDANEVAWLEEECRRENLMRQSAEAQQDQEPPADLIDEEAALVEQYENALLQQQHGGRAYDDPEDMDDDITDALFTDPSLIDLDMTSPLIPMVRNEIHESKMDTT